MASEPSTIETQDTERASAAIKDRRRARSHVNEALLKVGTPLDNRGVGKRFLPGLWQAAMNVVLSCLEKDDILVLLTDRTRSTEGDGTNHDALPKVIHEKAMPNYVKDVETAAATIMEAFEAALERMREDDIEDHFPETVFDASLQVLIPAWGPAHVRRALTEQSALIIRDVLAPLNFMEPSRNQAVRTAAPRKDKPATEAKTVNEPEPIPVTPPRRERVARHVTAYATSDVTPSGKAVWAAALVSHDDAGRVETREISGTMQDPTGRVVALKAMRECILAACETASVAKVMIETSSERCVRGAIDGERPGARLSGEESVWDEIDRARALHHIEFRHASHSIDRDLTERCDRMLRERAEDSH